MPLSVSKNSFAAGEVAPSLWYRDDLQKYGAGARKLYNCIVHPQGGVSNRPGSKLVVKGKTDGKSIALIPFEFNSQQRYVIEGGDFYFRFCQNISNGSVGQIVVSAPAAWLTATAYIVGDYVTQSGTIYLCIVAHTSGTFATDLAAGKWVAQTAYEVVSPYSEAVIPTVNYAQSADTLFMVCGSVRPKMLQRFGATDWRVSNYPFKNGPFMLANTTTANTIAASAVTGASITLTASVATFNALHVGALWQLKHYIPGQNSIASYSSNVSGSSIKCGGTWRIITHGTWSGKIAVEKSTDGGSTWTNIRSFASSADNNVNTFGTEATTDGAPFLVRVTMSGYVSGTANVDLTTDPFYQYGIAQITAYTDTTHVTATVLTEIGLTTATPDWAEGSWSDYRGWPKQISFNQNRLVFAATDSEPNTEWHTKDGDYYNFIRNSPLLDTDGITTPLPTRQLNAINGLVPLLDLIAFTSSSEWRSGSGESALSPTTIQNKIQGYNGSFGVRPVVIGNRAIFVDPSGAVIRDLGFQLQDDGFVGNHVSILSEHLFFNRMVMGMCFQQTPDSLLWVWLDDGTFLSCTYLREQDVIAWTQHETQGEVESMTVIQADGYKEVWLAVKRGTKRYIERFARRMESTAPEDQFFVDCGVTYYDPKTITAITRGTRTLITIASHGYSTGDLTDFSDIEGTTELNDLRFQVEVLNSNQFYILDEKDGTDIDSTDYAAYVSGGISAKAITTITGLDEYEGQGVAILADGNVISNYFEPETVTGGEVELDQPASKVHVGYGFYSDVETLDFVVPTKDGTSQGKKMKISKLVMQMLNSRGGHVGPDFDRLEELASNFREVYGAAIDLFSGSIPDVINSDFEDGARVCFRQKDPLPFTIAAVVPSITPGGVSTVTR